MENIYKIFISVLVITHSCTFAKNCKAVIPLGIADNEFDCEEPEGDTCDTLTFVYEGKKDLPVLSAGAIGEYKYIGKLNEDNSPVYERDDSSQYTIIQEWEGNHDGYDGWKVVSNMRDVDKRKKFAYIKTNDCTKTKPEECDDWKIRTEDELNDEKWDEGLKIECGHDGMGTGPIIGIVIAVIVVVGIIAAVGVVVFKKRADKRKNREGAATGGSNH